MVDVDTPLTASGASLKTQLRDTDAAWASLTPSSAVLHRALASHVDPARPRAWRLAGLAAACALALVVWQVGFGTGAGEGRAHEVALALTDAGPTTVHANHDGAPAPPTDVADVADVAVAPQAGPPATVDRALSPSTLVQGPAIAPVPPAAGMNPRVIELLPTSPPREKRRDATDAVRAASQVEAEQDSALAELKALRVRGAWQELFTLATELGTRTLDARTAEVVAFEQARALVRLQRTTEACAAIARHARRYPSAVDDLEALRARVVCP